MSCVIGLSISTLRASSDRHPTATGCMAAEPKRLRLGCMAAEPSAGFKFAVVEIPVLGKDRIRIARNMRAGERIQLVAV